MTFLDRSSELDTALGPEQAPSAPAPAPMDGGATTVPLTPGIPRITVRPRYFKSRHDELDSALSDGAPNGEGQNAGASFADRFTGFDIPEKPGALADRLRHSADLKIAKDDFGGAVDTFTANALNTWLLNIPRNAKAAVKSLESGEPFSREYEKTKDVEEAGARLNPKAAIAGDVAGVGAGMMTLPGIAGGANIAARAGRAAITAGLYGGTADLFDKKDPVHAALAAGLSAALGGVMAPAAEKIIGFIANRVKAGVTIDKFLGPDGMLTPEAEKAVRAAGINPELFTKVLHRKMAGAFMEKGQNPAVAREAAADEFGIGLNRGQAEQDMSKIREADLAARGASGEEAQKVAVAAERAQSEETAQASRNIGTDLAGARTIVDTPHSAGATINAEVGGQAARARAQVEAAEGAAAGEGVAARGAVDAQGRAIGDRIRGGRPELERPETAGEIAGNATREEAQRQYANYGNLYRDAFSREGMFNVDAFRGVGQRIKENISPEHIIDDLTTPQASRAIQFIDQQISHLQIQNRASPGGMVPADGDVRLVGVNLRGLEQVRKGLNVFYGNAANSSDRRAIRAVIDSYDGQIEHAMSNGLFVGDEAALPALREARAAFTRYLRTFTSQRAGDDVGRAMDHIVERGATAEEVARMLYGESRIGNSGLSVRLADRLRTTLGENSESWAAIRQGAWQRISQPRGRDGEIDTARAATNIENFAGTTLAQRLFTAEERAAMTNHARAIRQLEGAIESSPATRDAALARDGYERVFADVGAGGSPGVVLNNIIAGRATAEETAHTLFNAISSGNPGNAVRAIDAIERIAGRDSDSIAAMRQGVWQRLTQNAEGKDQPGAQKLAQNLNEFLNGRGRTIAERLYTAEQRATMQRYADVAKMMAIPKGARTNSDTAPALLALLRQHGEKVAIGIGAAVEGMTGGITAGVVGGFAGKGASASINKLLGATDKARALKRVQDLYSKVPPEKPKVSAPGVAPGAGVGAGLFGGRTF